MSAQFGFNLTEIFDIAQKIEENGEIFYRKAAEVYPDHSEFLLDLAVQEQGHHTVFTNMKEKAQTEESYFEDPDGTIKAHLDSIASKLVFDMDATIKEVFGNASSIIEIMDAAIGRENDTIAFFTEAKKLMKDEEDSKVMQDMIDEEVSHVRWINEKKSKI